MEEKKQKIILSDHSILIDEQDLELAEINLSIVARQKAKELEKGAV